MVRGNPVQPTPEGVREKRSVMARHKNKCKYGFKKGTNRCRKHPKRRR